MRRSWLTRLAVAVLASWASTVLPAAASEPEWRLYTETRWVALEVGAGERSVTISYTLGCSTRNEHAVVHETAASVTIELLREAQQGTLICPDILAFGTLQVPLGAPLAGRSIIGAAPPSDVPGMPFLTGTPVHGPDGLEPLAPRVIGFSPTDAKIALERADVHPCITVRYTTEPAHRHARVVWQSPSPGKPMRLSQARITLRVALP